MKILLYLYLLLVSAFATSQTLEELTVEEQLEDISFIKKELELLHPGLFTYQTKTEFEEAFKTLKESLQKNQTVFEFYNNLIPVINQVGCGHTTSKIPSKSLKIVQKKKKYIPLRVSILDDKMYITETLTDTSELFSGLEIVSINNISVPQFLESNLNRYPSDGRIKSRKYQMLEKYFSEDFSKFYDTSEFFKIEVMNSNQTNTVSLKGISHQELLSKTSKPELEAMELTLMDSLSTAIITVRNSKSKKVFEKFLDDSFTTIQTKNIKHLIIDVRYDSFNRDSDGALLYSYLTTEAFRYYKELEVTENYDVPKAIRWATHYPIEKDSTGKYLWKIHPQLEIQQAQANAFLGSVYVLIDGFTFSATSEFSSIIRDKKRGLLIGRETGGSYYGNNSGGMLRKVLPNSKIVVYIPPIHYKMAVTDIGNYSRGVLPDILSIPNNSGTDLTLENALKIIKQE